jgi:hypothetical protein
MQKTYRLTPEDVKPNHHKVEPQDVCSSNTKKTMLKQHQESAKSKGAAMTRIEQQRVESICESIE